MVRSPRERFSLTRAGRRLVLRCPRVRSHRERTTPKAAPARFRLGVVRRLRERPVVRIVVIFGVVRVVVQEREVRQHPAPLGVAQEVRQADHRELKQLLIGHRREAVSLRRLRVGCRALPDPVPVPVVVRDEPLIPVGRLQRHLLVLGPHVPAGEEQRLGERVRHVVVEERPVQLAVRLAVRGGEGLEGVGGGAEVFGGVLPRRPGGPQLGGAFEEVGIGEGGGHEAPEGSGARDVNNSYLTQNGRLSSERL